MSSKLPKYLLILTLAGVAPWAWSRAAGAQEESPQRYVERASATFADPSRPGRLTARVPYSTITVTAHDSHEVVAKARFVDGSESSTRQANGLRRLEAIGLELYARGNTIQLFPETNDRLLELVIQVPVETSLTLYGSNGGPITVTGVRGEIEVENSNAGIELIDVAGTVVASTSNGPIKASLLRMEPDRPMSFITSNAPVDVTLPDDIAANVYMETDNGYLYTDFDVVHLNDHPQASLKIRRRSPSPLRLIYGEIRGGGPEIRLRTDNADIYLRRRR